MTPTKTRARSKTRKVAARPKARKKPTAKKTAKKSPKKKAPARRPAAKRAAAKKTAKKKAAPKKAAPKKAAAKKVAKKKVVKKAAPKKAPAAAKKKSKKAARPEPRRVIDPNNPLGMKYTCFSCEAKFYDLNRPEPLCPKCGADQREKPKVDPKASQTAAPKRKKRVRPMAPLLDDDDGESVVVEQPELDLGIVGVDSPELVDGDDDDDSED